MAQIMQHCFGTVAPVADGPDHQRGAAHDVAHGKNAFEVVVMVDRGMTPAQALRSATVVPAELIRMDDIGQIRAGMHADLIAVAANPLEDIRTLENVSFVMKAGRVYKLVD